MYTSVLQVEWLDDEHAKQEVWGSRVGGREACTRWSFSWYFFKNNSLFLAQFFRFSGNYITAALVVPV